MSSKSRFTSAGLAVGLGLACSPLLAQAATTPSLGVSISQVVAATDYPTTHTFFAVAQLPDCSQSCSELLRSSDGAGTWTRTAAAGWAGSAVKAVRLAGRAVLVGVGAGSVSVSSDAGDTFHSYPVPGQFEDVATTANGLDVLLAGADGSQHLLRLPAGTVGTVTGAPDLTNVTMFFAPDYPGGPAPAFAEGLDRQTGETRIEACDGALRCGSPRPLAGLGKLAFSPSFARDRTVFLLTPHGLQRSTDAGSTFAPVTVLAPRTNTVVTETTALAFTLDFDANAGRGMVYAAVVSVDGTPGKQGRLAGGVFASADKGISWRQVGAEGDLGRGVLALAAAPDGRLIAGAFRYSTYPAGVFCTSDRRTWGTACTGYPPPISTSRSSVASGGVAGSIASRDVPASNPAVSDEGRAVTNAPVRIGGDLRRGISAIGAGVAVALGVGLMAILAWRTSARKRRKPRGGGSIADVRDLL